MNLGRLSFSCSLVVNTEKTIEIVFPHLPQVFRTPQSVIMCLFSLLFVQILWLPFLSGTAPILMLPKKRLEPTGLTGFLCVGSRWMNWFECTVLALSLVLCQGNMFGYFILVFSCSLFHHTVTKSHGVTTNGSLYEPSHQGWSYSLTATAL